MISYTQIYAFDGLTKVVGRSILKCFGLKPLFSPPAWISYNMTAHELKFFCFSKYDPVPLLLQNPWTTLK
jgi:hypothetical protein